jgi:hypothetical protein
MSGGVANGRQLGPVLAALPPITPIPVSGHLSRRAIC